MRRASYRALACGIVFCLATGCSSLADTLGISPPAHKLLDSAKDIRDTAPVPLPIGRELAKELLPPHLIQPGDSLLIQPVELDSPLRLPPDQVVQQDGTIDLGKYGQPIVAGKTVRQLEVELGELIKDPDKKPVAMTVRLVGKPSSVYYVFGEVNAPGAYPVTGRETVMDGVVAAGGLTRKASTENIILSRPTTPNGCRIVYPVCWPQIVQLGDTTTNYQLLPGDRIYVPSQGLLESFLPSKHQHNCSACTRPQMSCYGYGNGMGCGPGCDAPAPGGNIYLPVPNRQSAAGTNSSAMPPVVALPPNQLPGGATGPSLEASSPNSGASSLMLPSIPFSATDSK